MKALSENLYERGKNGTKYCRVRIPAALLAAYPPKKTHITRSLQTSDLREAKKRLKTEINQIDSEFALHRNALKEKQASYARKKLNSLSGEQLKALADHWVRQVLLNDERMRSEGLDDAEFDELGEQLEQQRSELGRMLATGRSDKILPAMNSFIHLCGLGKRAVNRYLAVAKELVFKDLRDDAGLSVSLASAVLSGIDELTRKDGLVHIAGISLHDFFDLGIGHADALVAQAFLHL